MDVKKTVASIEKAVEAEVLPVKKTTEAVVLDAIGQTVRIYSLEVHGDKFEELANMFISHNPGKTVVIR